MSLPVAASPASRSVPLDRGLQADADEPVGSGARRLGHTRLVDGAPVHRRDQEGALRARAVYDQGHRLVGVTVELADEGVGVALDAATVDGDDHVACTQPGDLGRPGRPPTATVCWMATLSLFGRPISVTSANSRMKAMRKCMADPATATSSREWNGCSR